MSATPLFQTAQNLCFKVVLMLYGQDCTWTEQSVTDTVLYNVPTDKRKVEVIGGRVERHTGYDNSDIKAGYIEFQQGQFPGLWDLVYTQGLNQHVTVAGINYVCTKSQSFFDGQTYRISINVATTDPVIAQ